MAELIDDDTKQFLTGFCMFAGLVLWNYWDSSFVVSYRTGVDLNKVVRLAKPKDCDWTLRLERSEWIGNRLRRKRL